jgi:hypothetical protein
VFGLTYAHYIPANHCGGRCKPQPLKNGRKGKGAIQAPCGSSGKERGVKVFVEGQLLADISDIEQAHGIWIQRLEEIDCYEKAALRAPKCAYFVRHLNRTPA